jgi:hypothetical protein
MLKITMVSQDFFKKQDLYNPKNIIFLIDQISYLV